MASVLFAAGVASQTLAPLLANGQTADWWFVFKFNTKSFPQCANGARSACTFGGELSEEKSSQQFIVASNRNPTLAAGTECLGDTDADPVGATFGNLYNGRYYYVLWNDQFYQRPEITGCRAACGAPWGHSKGVLGWDEQGNGFVMQVTTPSWPASGSNLFPRQSDGNTLGCIASTNNLLVSQSFFSVRLSASDVVSVLRALRNASIVTDPTNKQLVNNGGPAEIQAQVKTLGARSASREVVKFQLSTGVGVLSKPSKLHVPPWQLVSAELGGVPLRVATWWANPAIDSTVASTRIDCWDDSVGKPGAVQIAITGSWNGIEFGLKGGPGPNFNHAKVGVSMDKLRNFVILGDMNQQGALSDTRCDRSQNGRGGLFFIVENAALAESVRELLRGDSAPVFGRSR